MFRALVEEQERYDVESHVCTTKDGYLLKMFRLRPRDEEE